MANDNCVSLTVGKGISDAFAEIAAQREVDTLGLIEEVLIDDHDVMKPRPTC